MSVVTAEHRSPKDRFFERIGQTPLVRLNPITWRLPKAVELWAKLEWFNPGGSVKDRAAHNMILDAERRGVLGPGMTLLDASSGNTGIALAMLAARRGYKLVLCMPQNANEERKRTLRAYGATLELSSPLEGSDGAIVKARALAQANPDFLYLDQYANAANWRAHFEGTGPEIWKQSSGRITHFVAALGTSGTLMGTGRFLKEQHPSVQIISVEPESPFHGLEGLKHMESSIVPPIYDSSFADEKLSAPTEASIDLMRRLALEEGLLAGISSGAALWGALQIATRLQKGVVVTLFPDGGARYLSEPNLWNENPSIQPSNTGVF